LAVCFFAGGVSVDVEEGAVSSYSEFFWAGGGFRVDGESFAVAVADCCSYQESYVDA
jgi:hypothetical protein